MPTCGDKVEGNAGQLRGRYIAIWELFYLRRGEPSIMEFVERKK